MAVLTRDQILAASGKRTYKYVEVPEWDGSVRIRSLTGKERDKFERDAAGDAGRGGKKKSTVENLRAKLVALCAVDEDGRVLFASSYEVDQLGELPVAGLQRVFNACMALNGISDDDVEDLTEDFVPGASGAEPSTSA